MAALKPITMGSKRERRISFCNFRACFHRWFLACADGRAVTDHVRLNLEAPDERENNVDDMDELSV